MLSAPVGPRGPCESCDAQRIGRDQHRVSNPPTMLNSATSSLLALRPMKFVPVLFMLFPQATGTLALILKHVP